MAVATGLDIGPLLMRVFNLPPNTRSFKLIVEPDALVVAEVTYYPEINYRELLEFKKYNLVKIAHGKWSIWSSPYLDTRIFGEKDELVVYAGGRK